MKSDRPQWKRHTHRHAAAYACGLRPGDRVALKKPLAIRDHKNEPTGVVYPAGEVWLVLPGCAECGAVVWFKKPSGQACTWDDDAAQIDEWFERLATVDQHR